MLKSVTLFLFYWLVKRCVWIFPGSLSISSCCAGDANIQWKQLFWNFPKGTIKCNLDTKVSLFISPVNITSAVAVGLLVCRWQSPWWTGMLCNSHGNCFVILFSTHSGFVPFSSCNMLLHLVHLGSIWKKTKKIPTLWRWFLSWTWTAIDSKVKVVSLTSKVKNDVKCYSFHTHAYSTRWQISPGFRTKMRSFRTTFYWFSVISTI